LRSFSLQKSFWLSINVFGCISERSHEHGYRDELNLPILGNCRAPLQYLCSAWRQTDGVKMAALEEKLLAR